MICAAAPTSPAFITGRAIAGIGAAGLLQGAFGILTYVCPLEKRPLFLGGVVSLFGLFSSAGPVIGGALTEDTTWRWCFWMYVTIIRSRILAMKSLIRVPEISLLVELYSPR